MVIQYIIVNTTYNKDTTKKNKSRIQKQQELQNKELYMQIRMNSQEKIRSIILKNQKRQKILSFFEKLGSKQKSNIQLMVPISLNKYFKPSNNIYCQFLKQSYIHNNGPCEVIVRNEKCTQLTCLYDLDYLVDILTNKGQYSIQCQECKANIDLNGFYVDQDMEDAVNTLKCINQNAYNQIRNQDYSNYYMEITQKNEWILQDKIQKKSFILKESDMLTEYEQNYPVYESKQTSEFYENGWVFINENVKTQKEISKLQSVLYLFFPSLSIKKQWKKVEIYENVEENKQAYFQNHMSVSKLYSRERGQHSILACGGFGFPYKDNYESKTFEVPLFKDDPDSQIMGKVNLVNRNRMFTPRVFHLLINHQGKVYAIGGYIRDLEQGKDVPLKSCERYDPNTEKWEQISDLHHPRSVFTAISYKGMLFVIGGRVQDNQSNQDVEDLTIEYFDITTSKWTISYVFQQYSNQKYFTERSYCFVKQNDDLVIFGGRKQKNSQNDKPCERSRQAAQLNLITGEHKFTQDFLPPCGIQFEGITDFQGIYYNKRFIFGFKQVGKDNKFDFIIPSICKYYEQSKGDKFTMESYKKVLIE